MLTAGSKIVVPYDDSNLSKKALETAIALAKQNEETLGGTKVAVPGFHCKIAKMQLPA